MVVVSLELDMDLTQHKALNSKCEWLLNRHRAFRHRFLIPFEFQQLSKEYDSVYQKQEIEEVKESLKLGIQIRKRILARLQYLRGLREKSNFPNRHERKGCLSTGTTPFGSAHAATLGEKRYTNGCSPMLAFLPLNYQNSLIPHIIAQHSWYNAELERRLSLPQRVAQLRKQVATLSESIDRMEASTYITESHISENRLNSLKERIRSLKSIITELLRAMEHIRKDWSKLYGPESTQLRLEFMQLLMNQWHGNRVAWVEPKGEHAQIAAHFVDIQLAEYYYNSAGKTKIRLNLKTIRP